MGPDTTTRRDRQLRIARKRGDRLAVAVLETRAASIQRTRPDWTETELRALWGDR